MNVDDILYLRWAERHLLPAYTCGARPLSTPRFPPVVHRPLCVDCVATRQVASCPRDRRDAFAEFEE